jgi:hypothetical protein
MPADDNGAQDRIATLKAQLAQARAERDSARTVAAEDAAAARAKHDEAARARHERLMGLTRVISTEFGRQIDAHQGGGAEERERERVARAREEENARVAELARTMRVLGEDMDADRVRRRAAEARSEKGTRARAVPCFAANLEHRHAGG